MPLVESALAPLRDPQLAAKLLTAHGTGPAPAWLWSTDGSRIIWPQRRGAAIFGAADAGECQERRFGAKDATAALIVRLAATLPTSGQPRLERLRGFGANFGRALTCVCSRLILADGTTAVRIIATEPAGPPLPLREPRAPAACRSQAYPCGLRPRGHTVLFHAMLPRRHGNAVDPRRRRLRRPRARQRQRQRRDAQLTGHRRAPG